MRVDTFELDDDTKIELIQKHFAAIMHTLGLDLSDDSLKDTPKRVAKMYVKEIFRGLLQHMLHVWGGQFPPEWVVSLKRNQVVKFNRISTQAFANYTNCLFVISTHIIEVGEELREHCENIQFRYLPTVMEGSVPRYTYLLKEGITSDRQGMMIIENERILEIIGTANS